MPVLFLFLFSQIIVSDPAPYRIQTLLTATNLGDGGPAREAILNLPYGIAEDAEGNIYIAETRSNRIRRINSEGLIETYTTANRPTLLLFTPQQELLYFDDEFCMIRKIRTDKSVIDIAGSGTCAAAQGFTRPGFGGGPLPGLGGGFGGSSDRDGKALETSLGNLGAMIYDNEGRLTFTETSLHILRRLTSDGNLETIAGSRQSAFSGDNEKAIDASFSSPTGLVQDADGNFYIADTGNCRIRRIDSTLYIETFIGTGTCASSTSTLTGTRAINIEQPGALHFDRNARALFIAQPRAYRLLRYSLEENRMQPVLGNGRVGTTVSEEPLQITINETGPMLQSPRYGLIVSAPSSFQLYRLQSGRSEVFAGQWPQNAGVQLLDPRGITTTTDGSILLLDAGTNLLLKIDPDNQITRLAGTAYPVGFSKGDNGPATEATLDAPTRLIVHPNGNIYIAEASRLRVLTPEGILRTIRTSLSNPSGLAIDSSGRLLFSESGNHRILRIDLNTNVATRIAGDNGEGFSGDGGAATSAKLASPGELAFDAQGNLLIADTGNRRLRRITSDGRINTIAGNGLPFSYADITGDLATRTGFGTITSLKVDTLGRIHISEEKRLTRIGTNGRLQILTGYQQQADDGTITWLNEELNQADAITILPDTNLLYTVRGNPSLKRLFN
jgi:sugar lactone lactonase YvrE